jgi:hypothetical protein
MLSIMESNIKARAVYEYDLSHLHVKNIKLRPEICSSNVSGDLATLKHAVS